MKQSATMAAWLTPSYTLKDLLEAPTPQAMISKLCLCVEGQDMKTAGWTPVGMADVTLTLSSSDQLIQDYIARLQLERKLVEVESTHRLEQLDNQIQNLLALPSTVEISNA